MQKLIVSIDDYKFLKIDKDDEYKKQILEDTMRIFSENTEIDLDLESSDKVCC